MCNNIPDEQLPKICLSADTSLSKIVKKPLNKADEDLYHGHDGLGDC